MTHAPHRRPARRWTLCQRTGGAGLRRAWSSGNSSAFSLLCLSLALHKGRNEACRNNLQFRAGQRVRRAAGQLRVASRPTPHATLVMWLCSSGPARPCSASGTICQPPTCRMKKMDRLSNLGPHSHVARSSHTAIASHPRPTCRFTNSTPSCHHPVSNPIRLKPKFDFEFECPIRAGPSRRQEPQPAWTSSLPPWSG